MLLFKRTILLLAMILWSSVLIVGCQATDGPAENVGEKVDNAIEKTGDKLEEAGDKAKKALKN